MPDAPKLHVYVVAALFAPAEVPEGQVAMNTWFATDPSIAAASIATQAAQQGPITSPLQALAYRELTEEWLVAALNAIRTGGKPGEVTPLKIVPSQPGDGEPAPVAQWIVPPPPGGDAA